MKNQKMPEIEKRVYDLLNENSVHAEVYQFSTLPIICVEISWGDWKHDHARADWLIADELGGTLLRTNLVEEDGSDCYSAVHYYAF